MRWSLAFVDPRSSWPTIFLILSIQFALVQLEWTPGHSYLLDFIGKHTSLAKKLSKGRISSWALGNLRDGGNCKMDFSFIFDLYCGYFLWEEKIFVLERHSDFRKGVLPLWWRNRFVLRRSKTEKKIWWTGRWVSELSWNVSNSHGSLEISCHSSTIIRKHWHSERLKCFHQYPHPPKKCCLISLSNHAQ